MPPTTLYQDEPLLSGTDSHYLGRQEISTPIESADLIHRALAEDLGAGDVTTEALIPSDLWGMATILAKSEGILAGVDIALAVFRHIDSILDVSTLKRDGSVLEPGSLIAKIEGPVASILKAERTALNFLQRLSGIATQTHAYVAAVEGYPARILDTRKTTPGLRDLEKHAVRVGGGQNHRRGLDDGILIKDNHIQALRRDGMKLREIIAKARTGAAHNLKIEVEVENTSQVKEALDANAEILLLDNMELNHMAKAVEMADGRALTEASGGITLETARAVAATRVDFISVGALTHSAPALDISLNLD